MTALALAQVHQPVALDLSPYGTAELRTLSASAVKLSSAGVNLGGILYPFNIVFRLHGNDWLPQADHIFVGPKPPKRLADTLLAAVTHAVNTYMEEHPETLALLELAAAAERHQRLKNHIDYLTRDLEDLRSRASRVAANLEEARQQLADLEAGYPDLATD